METIEFCWPEGKTGAFTTSYDDGVKQDRRLIEIFNKAGIRGTWNLNGALAPAVGTPDSKIALPDIAHLYVNHEVAVHGFTHPFLERIPGERVIGEITTDRITLETAVGYPVKGMALPFGTHTKRVLEQLHECGIVHCRTVHSTGTFALPADFLEWHPTCHHNDNLADLWLKFKKCGDKGKLFYLWGHSYEFDSRGNWNVIEEFSQTVRAAREDGWLWCATNMEIYEYVHAWRRLWCALDGNSVRNIHGVTLWMRVKDKLVSVAPGATVRLCPL